jgi:hypothetical protein
MRKPSIHINGSSARSLFDGYYAALQAMQAARWALTDCAPHGRDYYLQEATPGRGCDAANEAMDEHRARLINVDTICTELEALAFHVQDAGGL